MPASAGATGICSHVDSEELAREIVESLPLPPGFTIVVEPLPTLLTHRTPLHQVLRNLISNAVKHHNRPDGRVEILARDHGDHIEFIVQDDGPGIAEDYQEQSSGCSRRSSRDSVEGSGMGLALVKKIVEGRGGTIDLESAEGRGAKFRFTWPRGTEG